MTKNNSTLLLILICLVTMVIYQGVFSAGFVSDDYQYIVNNPYIRDISWKGIKAIFSNYYFDNYHPITTLTWATEYSLWHLNPKPYHIDNLLIHLLNIVLVFILFKRLTNNNNLALLVSALFAVHPLHVEAVTWISQRKDVVYSLFYLLSIIFYVQFLSAKKWSSYTLALIMFILSLLSKSMAVTLPLVLLIIDYYKSGFNAKTLINKIPFFLLSIGFAVLTLHTQKGVTSASDFTPVFPFVDRLFLVCYGICLYLLKLIVPVGLALFHFYPKKTDGYFPLIVYISPVILAALAFLIYKLKKFKREAIFGTLFFLASISIVLQFIPAGCAIISERYTYLPYLGLFFIITQYTISPKQKDKKLKTKEEGKSTITYILLGVLVLFAVITFNRNEDWKSYKTLMNDLVEKEPDNAYSYYSRSKYFLDMENNSQAALENMNRAIELDSTFADSYNNRGFVLGSMNRPQEALHDFNKAISLDTTQIKYYSNRAIAEMQLSDFKGALSDYNKCIAADPANAQLHYSKGTLLCSLRDTMQGIQEINKAIELNPQYADAYLQLGFISFKKQDYKSALKNFDLGIQYKPDFGEAYFNRAVIKLYINDSSACSDLHIASGLGYKQAESVIADKCK